MLKRAHIEASGLWPTSRCGPSRSRAGRARTTVELSENEWAKACNQRDGYRLYAVYDCATARPRLARVRDPFAKLLARSRLFSAFSIPASSVQAAACVSEEESGARRTALAGA